MANAFLGARAASEKIINEARIFNDGHIKIPQEIPVIIKLLRKTLISRASKINEPSICFALKVQT